MFQECNRTARRFKHKEIEDLLDDELRDTVIAYDFKFTMSETNDGSATSSFTFPFSNGKFSVDFSFGENKARQNEREFDIVEYFTELLSDVELIDECSDEANWQYAEKKWKYPVTGGIGLEEVIETYTKLATLQKFNARDFDPASGGSAAERQDQDKRPGPEERPTPPGARTPGGTRSDQRDVSISVTP